VTVRSSDMTGQSTTARHPVNLDIIRPDPDTEEVDARGACRPGQAFDVPSLARADGIDRVSIGRDGPHLDYNASSPVQSEDVELTATDVDIATDEAEPLAD
jgi:hypothetical protein